MKSHPKQFQTPLISMGEIYSTILGRASLQSVPLWPVGFNHTLKSLKLLSILLISQSMHVYSGVSSIEVNRPNQCVENCSLNINWNPCWTLAFSDFQTWLFLIFPWLSRQTNPEVPFQILSNLLKTILKQKQKPLAFSKVLSFSSKILWGNLKFAAQTNTYLFGSKSHWFQWERSQKVLHPPPQLKSVGCFMYVPLLRIKFSQSQQKNPKQKQDPECEDEINNEKQIVSSRIKPFKSAWTQQLKKPKDNQSKPRKK